MTLSRCRSSGYDEYDVTDKVQYADTKVASLFDVQYLRNHRNLDIGVLGYIGIV